MQVLDPAGQHGGRPSHDLDGVVCTVEEGRTTQRRVLDRRRPSEHVGVRGVGWAGGGERVRLVAGEEEISVRRGEIRRRRVRMGGK